MGKNPNPTSNNSSGSRVPLLLAVAGQRGWPAARKPRRRRSAREREGEKERGERESLPEREKGARGHGGLAGGESPGRGAAAGGEAPTGLEHGRGGSRRGGAGRAWPGRGHEFDSPWPWTGRGREFRKGER